MYPYLSGRANLELLASLDQRGTDRREIDEVLDLVELRDRAPDRVGQYSQGMRQRLGIASCLIRRPRLLLLDEPANGVDPGGIRFLRALIRRLADEGITVMLSSHLLAEVAEVCSRVAVIDGGRIVYEGSLTELGASTAPRYRLEATDPARAATVLRGLGAVGDLHVDGLEVSFTLPTASDTVAVTRALADAGLGINALAREQATLEELFFRLTEPAIETAA